MTPDEHKQRHIELHRSLDELFADYMRHHKDQTEFLQMPLIELINWSYSQTIEPVGYYERNDAGHAVKSMEDRE